MDPWRINQITDKFNFGVDLDQRVDPKGINDTPTWMELGYYVEKRCPRFT
jgi:hypothetical protein